MILLIENYYDLEKKWELNGALATYITVSLTISTISGRVNDLCLMHSGSSDGYIQIRDGGVASTVLWRMNIGTTNLMDTMNFYPGIRFGTNLYAELSNCTLSLSWTP